MSVSYVASLKSLRMTDVINAIDAMTGPGVMELGTAGMAIVLVAFTLRKPSFTESGGTITMTGTPTFSAAGANGKAASARIKNGANAVVVSGLTVDTSGADINLNDTNIAIGQNVTLSSFSITHAP